MSALSKAFNSCIVTPGLITLKRTDGGTDFTMKRGDAIGITYMNSAYAVVTESKFLVRYDYEINENISISKKTLTLYLGDTPTAIASARTAVSFGNIITVEMITPAQVGALDPDVPYHNIPEIGDLALLTTVDKTNLVKAINEVRASLASVGITLPGLLAILGYTPAELDSYGKILSSQLPSYVDDVIELLALSETEPVTTVIGSKYYKPSMTTIYTYISDANGSGSPGWDTVTAAPPESGKVYTDISISGGNKTYRWSGSALVMIGSDISLGETSSTAYRGDYGKTAYDHSQASGNAHNMTGANLPMTGYTSSGYTAGAILTTDTLLAALAKLYLSISANGTAITNLGSAKANKAVAATVSVAAASWSGGSATITVSGITASSILGYDIENGAATTLAQIETFQSAMILITAKGTNSVTLKCLGVVPSIAIPITFTIFG